MSRSIVENGRGSARITVPEICRRLALGERAVYGLLEAKIIPAIRVGKRWVIARYA
jgi:excisionase family DNA binding protein